MSMSWSERRSTRGSVTNSDQNVGEGEEAGENLQRRYIAFVIQFFPLALCSKETLLIPWDMGNLMDKRASQQVSGRAK